MKSRSLIPQIGKTERMQLLFYLANQNKIDALSANQSGHNVMLKQIRVQHSVATFSLSDSRSLKKLALNNNTVVGGNSYRTIYRGEKHRYACSYVDHMNDTYDVICTLFDSCAYITIHLTYVNYGAYRWDGVFINELVWNGKLCSDNFQISRLLSNTVYQGWYRDNSKQSFRWVKKFRRDLVTTGQIRSCINSWSWPKQLIGDSHLRYVVDAIIRLMENNTLSKYKINSNSQSV